MVKQQQVMLLFDGKVFRHVFSKCRKYVFRYVSENVKRSMCFVIFVQNAENISVSSCRFTMQQPYGFLHFQFYSLKSCKKMPQYLFCYTKVISKEDFSLF